MAKKKGSTRKVKVIANDPLDSVRESVVLHSQAALSVHLLREWIVPIAQRGYRKALAALESNPDVEIDELTTSEDEQISWKDGLVAIATWNAHYDKKGRLTEIYLHGAKTIGPLTIVNLDLTFERFVVIPQEESVLDSTSLTAALEALFLTFPDFISATEVPKMERHWDGYPGLVHSKN